MLVEVDDENIFTVPELGEEIAERKGWKFVTYNNDPSVGVWDIKFLDGDGKPLYMTLDGCVYDNDDCYDNHEVDTIDIRDALDIELVWGRLTYNDGTPNEPVAIVNR